MILFLPVKPAVRTQGFGADPGYYARFKDQLGRPMKGHMGIDFVASHGTPVFAAHSGLAQFLRDEHGGEGIYITGNGYRTVNWHLIGDTDPSYPSPIPTDGHSYPIKTGDLIGYANKTGAPYEATGDHFHFALYLLNSLGQTLNISNGFNGAVDPSPYLSTVCACDVTLYLRLLQQLVGLYQQLKGNK